MEARALIFADDAERLPRLFACSKCRLVVSVGTAGTVEEAKRRADECCKPAPPPPEVKCACGTVLPGINWKQCSVCADAAIIAAATIVTEVPDIVCIVGTDRYFQSIDEAAEEFPGGWAHPCTSKLLSVDPKREAESLVETVFEHMCDEAFEDAGDHVEGGGALEEAFEAALVTFNAAQTASSWSPDTSKIYRLPGEPVGEDTLIDEGAEIQ